MKKLECLQAIFEIINETSSKEEIVKMLSSLIEFVKQIKEKNKEVIDSLDTKYSDRVNEIEKDLTREITKFFVQESKKVRSGKDGTNGKDGKDGRNGEDADEGRVALQAQKMTLEALKPLLPTIDQIEDDLPKLGEPIRDALELLKDDERLDKSAIKGLDELEERLIKMVSSSKSFVGGVVGGGVGKHNVNAYDLSGVLDGVTKTFSLPAFWKVISVFGSSFPNTFRPLIDYTTNPSNHTITFTSEIDAGSTLARGQTIIIQYAE